MGWARLRIVCRSAWLRVLYPAVPVTYWLSGVVEFAVSPPFDGNVKTDILVLAVTILATGLFIYDWMCPEIIRLHSTRFDFIRSHATSVDRYVKAVSAIFDKLDRFYGRFEKRYPTESEIVAKAQVFRKEFDERLIIEVESIALPVQNGGSSDERDASRIWLSLDESKPFMRGACAGAII